MTIAYEVIQAECQFKHLAGVPDRFVGPVDGMANIRRGNYGFEVESKAQHAEFEDTDVAEIVAATAKTANNAGIPA
jgi:hypothetical protein